MQQKSSDLILDVSKTIKEMIIDFCKQENDPETIIIQEKEVERVEKHLNTLSLF